MLLRISLILAIVAGAAVGALNFVKVKDKIVKLQDNLKTETEAHRKFETDYRRTKSDLDKTNAVLKTTQETLKATTEEKDKALADLSAEKKHTDTLTKDLDKTRGERDDAQRDLAAYKATGYNPEQILAFGKQVRALQDNLDAVKNENQIIGQKLKRTENELAIYKDPSKDPPLPAALKGQVLVSDPKWQFVVLNVGEDQGVLAHGQLLVNRNGKLVAKVVVSSVQKDRCVANIMPGWQIGEVVEGDQVIPAHPSS
jgi:hypothetical protein